MHKAVVAIAAAATIAAGALTVPTPADAGCRGHRGRCRHCIGGLAAAAIIGGAIAANSRPSYYGPAPGYVAYDGYRARYPHGCGGGYWARRPMYDRWGNSRLEPPAFRLPLIIA